MTRRTPLALAATFLVLAGNASAQQFSGGIPAGWNCTGVCGTSAADGVVGLAPSGGTKYGYVSTYGSVAMGTFPTTNYSKLTSVLFAGTAGQTLSVKFNFVSSETGGIQYGNPDYAWAKLSGAASASLYTATYGTTPLSGAATWSPINSSFSSSYCSSSACGSTGWVTKTYTFATTGMYQLEFGVANSVDMLFDTGLAFDDITINGQDVQFSVVPEPATYVLLASGLAVIGAVTRRRSA